MKPLASNTLLQNRYLVVHLIGKGGMGEVYLAIDQRLGNAVALKRTVFFDDEILGSAFEREARILARLRHNVLPKVSDHFLEEGNQYLVMEYIAGEDLSLRLQNSNKPFPLDWVMFWADRLLDALDYLHTNEPPIIHRDIKPQNLKLTEDNQIVLLDFGLSKNTVDAARVSTTAPSVVGYTTQYAPMEQIRGTGTDARSDIFSLSSTLYQLLTNQIPPDSLTRADRILGGNIDPLISPTDLNPQIPAAISTIVLKGMEISQEKRIASAREMQKLFRDAYAPEMRNQNLAHAAVFDSPAQSNDENISLKTNVNSTANPEARDLNTNAQSNPVAFPASANRSGRFDSVSQPKSVPNGSASASFSNENFISDADSNSHASLRDPENHFAGAGARKHDVPPSIENKSNKKSTLVFAAVGAVVLVFAAIGFSFYKYNLAAPNNTKISATQEEAATKPAPQPTVEAVVEQPQATSNVESKVVQNNTAEKETPARGTSEVDKNAKAIQPPNAKINQKPAPPPDQKNTKTTVKLPTKAEQKPTPLPRILP